MHKARDIIIVVASTYEILPSSTTDVSLLGDSLTRKEIFVNSSNNAVIILMIDVKISDKEESIGDTAKRGRSE